MKNPFNPCIVFIDSFKYIYFFRPIIDPIGDFKSLLGQCDMLPREVGVQQQFKLYWTKTQVFKLYECIEHILIKKSSKYTEYKFWTIFLST